MSDTGSRLRAYDYVVNGVPHTIMLPPGEPTIPESRRASHDRSVLRAQQAIAANKAAGVTEPLRYILIDGAGGAVGSGALHDQDDAEAAANLAGWFHAMGLHLGYVLMPGAAEQIGESEIDVVEGAVVTERPHG